MHRIINTVTHEFAESMIVFERAVDPHFILLPASHSVSNNLLLVLLQFDERFSATLM
jgi:hypothetical protein